MTRAVEAGGLDPGRLESLRDLTRENDALDRRANERAMARRGPPLLAGYRDAARQKRRG